LLQDIRHSYNHLQLGFLLRWDLPIAIPADVDFRRQRGSVTPHLPHLLHASPVVAERAVGRPESVEQPIEPEVDFPERFPQLLYAIPAVFLA